MCDMIQFVAVVLVPNETSVTLIDHCMQHVLLKINIYHLVVLDDRCPSIVFSLWCTRHWILILIFLLNKIIKVSLSKNHKFINKSITIAEEDRGANDVCVADGDVAGCVWNSSPIDMTDILQVFLSLTRNSFLFLY